MRSLRCACSPDLSESSQACISAVLVFDGMAAIPRSFDFRQTLIAVVTVFDAVAVPMVPLDLRQTVRPLVRILDRVALRGARHGLPYPGHCDHAERHEEVASRYVADGHVVLIRRCCGTWPAPRQRCIWSVVAHHVASGIYTWPALIRYRSAFPDGPRIGCHPPCIELCPWRPPAASRHA